MAESDYIESKRAAGAAPNVAFGECDEDGKQEVIVKATSVCSEAQGKRICETVQ